jgi:uncharacterized membrane protein HdeD (DUF308 family)
MLMALVRNWWMMALRGALAMALGVVILAWGSASLGWLVILVGTYALLDGALALLSVATAAPARAQGWPVVLEGLASIALGIVAYVGPFAGARFVGLIAGWGLITGVLEMFAARRLPRTSSGHWFLLTGGAFSIFLALLLAALPQAVSEPVARAVGIYALAFGIALACAAWGFRRAVMRDDVESRVTAGALR